MEVLSKSKLHNRVPTSLLLRHNFSHTEGDRKKDLGKRTTSAEKNIID